MFLYRNPSFTFLNQSRTSPLVSVVTICATTYTKSYCSLYILKATVYACKSLPTSASGALFGSDANYVELNKTHAEGAEWSVAENLIAKNSLVLRKVCTYENDLKQYKKYVLLT